MKKNCEVQNQKGFQITKDNGKLIYLLSFWRFIYFHFKKFWHFIDHDEPIVIYSAICLLLSV